MTLNKDQTTLAKIAEGTEENIARLYQVYADKFPEFANFWSGLVMEQIDHVNTIHGLMNKVRAGLLNCNENRVDCQSLESLQNKVKQEIIRAKEGQVSASEAFFIALEIEKGVSKREYSEALDEDLEEVRNVFSYLASDTERHINWIEEHLKPKEE
jgi:rubrerythrin